MNWEFLKTHRETKTRQGASSGPHGQDQPGEDIPPRAEVRLLKPLDSRALGTARESVRLKLEDFEASLQAVAQLPDQFRSVMAPIENAVNTMALLRSRLELAEENLAAEQRKTTSLMADVTKLQGEAERLGFALKSEEGNGAAIRERNSALEAAVADLKHENSNLAARVARIEPMLREAVAARDSHELELASLRQAKSQGDDMLASLKAELSSARDELANRDNIYATLHALHAKASERLEESGKAIGELEALLKSATEKFSFASSALARERNAVRALRTENEQLHKEREESRHQFDSQLDAARARYDFVEKMLEDSRARFHEETRQLSLARRERAERDREIGRMTLAIEAAQREIADLRSHVGAASESAASTSTLLASEIEQRRKIELEVDMLRAENSNLLLKHKSLSESARANLATIADATSKFQAKMASLRAENEQLRASLNASRNNEQSQYEDEFASLFEDPQDGKQLDAEPNIVSLHQTS